MSRNGKGAPSLLLPRKAEQQKESCWTKESLAFQPWFFTEFRAASPSPCPYLEPNLHLWNKCLLPWPAPLSNGTIQGLLSCDCGSLI